MKMYKFKVKSLKLKVRKSIQNSRLLKIFLFFAFITIYYSPFTIHDIFAEDKIAAIVNNDVITQKDLGDFINFMRVQLSQELKGLELDNKIESMKSDLLDKLIEDRLILQEAQKAIEEAREKRDLYTLARLGVDENRVKAKIGDVRKNYFTDTAFQADLAKQGLTQADLEKKVREQMLTLNIVELKVRDKITVRPDEVTNFYNKNKKEFITPQARDLQVIVLENEDLAKAFAYDLRSGQKLEDLATRYPITINQLKVVRGEELLKEIKAAVFKLGISEISNPVKVEDKYYIFKLLNITPPKQQNLGQVQDLIHNFLLEMKMQEKLNSWLEELREKAYIKVMR